MANKKTFSFYVLQALTRPFALLPLGFHRAVAGPVGWVTGNLFRYRRDVTLVNLSRCFPDKKYDEIKQICRSSYAHLAKIFCEALWFGGIRESRRFKESGIVRIQNPEYLNDLYDRGKGVIILAAHTGNFELMGGLASYADPGVLHFDVNALAVVYKRLSNKGWDQFMWYNRTAPMKDPSSFEGLVESNSIMRFVYDHRNEAMFYEFITDQYPYNDTSIPVKDFMHQKTTSMVGAVALAKMFGMPVCYLSYRDDLETGNYTMTFRHLTDNAAEEEIPDLLDRYYAMLEEDLNAQPWNYLWTHKRWK